MFSEEDRLIIDRVIAGMHPEIIREDTKNPIDRIYSRALPESRHRNAFVEKRGQGSSPRDRRILRCCVGFEPHADREFDETRRRYAADIGPSGNGSEARADAFAAIRAVLEPGLEQSVNDVAEAQKQVAETEAALMEHLDSSDKERAMLLAEVDRVDKEIADSGLESKIAELEAKVAEIDAELIRIGKQKIYLSFALSETSKMHAEEKKCIKSEIDRLDKLIVSRAGSINYLKRVKDFIDPLAANRMERKPKNWDQKIEKLK